MNAETNPTLFLLWPLSRLSHPPAVPLAEGYILRTYQGSDEYAWQTIQIAAEPVDPGIDLDELLKRYLSLPLPKGQWSWRLWSAIGRRIGDRDWSLSFLAVYVPVSVMLLLVLWAGLLIFAFGVTYHGLGDRFQADRGSIGFGALLYMSGSTFFTLGLGDITSPDPLARFFMILETATGYIFLGLIILIVTTDGVIAAQARITSRMGLRLLKDLTEALSVPVDRTTGIRLTEADLPRLRADLDVVELTLPLGPKAPNQLLRLVRRYDAHLLALSRSLVIPLPPWFALAAGSQAPSFSTHSERGED
jgi:hypothetical protein